MSNRGNPNWGKMSLFKPTSTLCQGTEFERAALEFKLQPSEYECSTRLQQWARMNLNKFYIPENLLKVWGLSTVFNA